MMKRLGPVVVAALLLAVVSLAGCAGGPTVPNVVGTRPADAVRALEAAGYTLGEVSPFATTDITIGMVAQQTPAAGESAKKGTAVALSISSSDGKNVLVPTVAGLSQVTAEGVATTLGLKALVTDQYSETVAKGLVSGQVPQAGSTVPAGSAFVIAISKGIAPEKAKAPDVVGKAQADAESVLKAAGFTSEAFSVYNSKVPKGKVIVQSPEAGKSIVSGSKVQIVVSLGKGTGAAKVPSVKGKKEADAKTAIESAGLKVKKLTQYDTKVAKGVVVAQFPEADATAAKGSEVIIMVSLGAEPAQTVEVPNVVGKSETAGTSTLKDAGFSVTTESVSQDATATAIVYQFPAAGTKVAPSTSVLIVIGPPR